MTEERCVICGNQYGPDSFEDGLRCKFCQEADEQPEFEYEGFFTHYICPKCGWNDWAEGDLRGEEVRCEGCNYVGRIPS